LPLDWGVSLDNHNATTILEVKGTGGTRATVTMNAIGMTTGAAVLLVAALLADDPLLLPHRPNKQTLARRQPQAQSEYQSRQQPPLNATCSRSNCMILSLTLTISVNLRVRLLTWHGSNPKHPKETEGTGINTRRFAKPCCPPPTAHRVYAAESRCCQARNSILIMMTTTAPNSEALRMPCATFVRQPGRHGRYSSRPSQGPAGQYTAGNADL
jgi:hypothetical protein